MHIVHLATEGLVDLVDHVQEKAKAYYFTKSTAP